jgi:histone demethylase
MSDRHRINKEINYRTVIPYKNLMLDIYIHEKELG